MTYRTRPESVEAAQYLTPDAPPPGVTVYGEGAAAKAQIETARDVLVVRPGEWVVRCADGRCLRCSDAEFRARYEAVDETSRDLCRITPAAPDLDLEVDSDAGATL